jgi:flagellar assembly protein FliH
MSARFHTLTLSQVLRDVRLVVPPDGDEATEQLMRDREQAAYEHGRIDGEQALSEQLVQQRRELVDLQNGVLAALRQSVPQIVRETEHAVTALALEVARKLVAGMPISAEMVQGTIQEALAQVEESAEYHIYVHPDDLDLLERANCNLLTQQAAAERMHFHRAAEVSRGGCLVKTHFGIIDGQRETKMELLKKSLLA